MAVKYSFNGSSNGLNPPLVLVRGVTYTFNVNTPGHPFWIKASPVTGVGGVYSNGVTNNGASSGTITFTVPQNAPNILYYISQNDDKLVNEIFVVNSTISIIGDPYIQGNARVSGSVNVTGSSNISGSQIISGSSRITGSQSITGSLNVSGSEFITGSLFVTGSQFLTGSLIITGSQLISGSLNISGSTFLTGSARITGSQSITGSLNVSGSSFTTGSSFISGTLAVTGSTNLSGSVNILGSGSVSGSWTVTGDITARQIIISSSVIYVTESYADGSHVFGNTQDDTHQFTGSVFVSHSLTSLAFTGSSYTGSFTGSFAGTASWAISSSYAVSASHLIGQSPTASYALTASYVQNAISASYISERVKSLNGLTYSVPAFLKLTGDNTIGLDVTNYLSVTDAASTYVTATFLTSNYSTTSTIASTYQTILSNPITGTGTRTANYVAKFGSSSTIQNSIIYDNGSIVGVNNTGTVSGGGTLQVGGDVNITGAFKINGTTISTSQWITTGSDIYFNAGKVYIGNTTTNRTGEAYKFTISPGTNANLAVGTTDPGVSILSHSDAFSFGSPSFQSMSFVASSYVWYGGFAAAYMTFSDSTYKINVTGNIGASAYYETSDIRLKNIIEQNPNVDLSSLNVIKYTRKNDESNQIHYGYSAQDVQKICKDLVNDGEEYLTLNYTNVHTLKIAQLEKEIKELKQLIRNK